MTDLFLPKFFYSGFLVVILHKIWVQTKQNTLMLQFVLGSTRILHRQVS